MHPLDGAREKVSRAREHVELLDAESTTWVKEHPYRVTRKYYGKTSHITWRIAQKSAAPLRRWGVVIGDVFHELNSALDHIAWQFALKTRPEPSRDTAFPVCIHDGDWESKGTRKMLHHIGTDERAFIKSKQPYPAPDGHEPSTHAFAMLRLLSRIDKHQVINAAVLLPLDTKMTLINIVDPSGFGDFILYDEPVKQGAKLARLFVEPENSNMDMNVHLSLYIGFVGPQYRRMDKGRVFTVLDALVHEVGRTIDEADLYF